MGVTLILFGLDMFFELLPHNQVMIKEFVFACHGLLTNEFIMSMVGVVELISGICSIIGRWIIVALSVMVSIAFGILGFNFKVDI